MSETNECDPITKQPELKRGIVYTGDKGPKFGTRHLQVFMMGLGSAFIFATKSVLSIAIVAMTDNTTSSNPDVPTYDWDNKSVIISSILWSGVGVNLLAGYLGKRLGPKWLVVGAGFLNSICFMFIPLSAEIGGSTGVIICRLFQGTALGFINSLNSVVMGRWVPPEERSRLGFLGSGITTVLTMLVSVAAGLISASYLGWPWIFYIFGIVCIVWTALYAFIGSQSADVHPRINPKEKQYILTTLFRTNKDERTPFFEIFTSIHVWATVVGQAGFNWITIMLATELTIFLSKAMDYNLQSSATISSVPALLGLAFGVALSILSDFIPKRGILTLVNSRRMFHLTGSVGVSITLICMTLIPVEYKHWSIVMLCIATFFVMCTGVGGASINLLDISPKFAGVISGLAQTVSQAVSLFAPLTVQWICTDESDASQWRTVFLVAGAVTVSTGIFFVIFASGERQPWEMESDQEAEIEVKKRRSSIISASVGLGA